MTTKNLICMLALVSMIFSCASTAHKRSFGEVIDDEVVAVNLKTKFMKDKAVPAKKILIRVWKGVVTLKGELDSQSSINRAIELAEKQRGVREVNSLLVLQGFGTLKETFLKRATKEKKDRKTGPNVGSRDVNTSEESATDLDKEVF